MLGLADDGDVDVRLGLERSKRLLLPVTRSTAARAVRWGLRLRGGRATRSGAGLGLCPERGAAAPRPGGDRLHVNQARERPAVQLSDLLDGAARHTPEGMAFTQRGLADVGGAVADRDAPFGDYGQGPATV